MNETLHIVRKDARRIRWGLAAWTILIAMHVALSIARPSLALLGMGMAMVASQLTSLTSMIGLVMMVLIVSWLMHEDPAADREAFWLTRPIHPGRLTCAKLTVAGAVLVLLPFLGELITMAVFRVGAYGMWRATPAILLEQAVWMLTLTAAAALTPSMTRYVLVLVGAAAAFVLIISVMVAGAFLFADTMRQSAPRPQLTNPVPSIVTTSLAIAVSLWVVLYQYRRRRAKIAAIVGMAGFVGVMAVPIVWPSHAGLQPDPDPGAWARDEALVAAGVRPEPPNVSDAFSFSRRNTGRKRIAVPVRLSGVPDDFFVQAVEAHTRLEVAGATLVSTEIDSAMVRRSTTAEVRNDEESSLRGALGSARLAGRAREGEYEQWPVLLSVTDQEFAQYAHTPGRLTSALEFYLARSIPAGTVFLEPGRSIADETRRFDIVGIERRVDGCTVMLREISINPLLRPRAFSNQTFVLRNAARQEAVQGDLESMESGSSSPMLFLLSIAFGGNAHGASDAGGHGFGVRSYAYRYTSRSPSDAPGPVVDAAWLAGAELVRITTTYAGHITRAITIEDFRMVR